MGLLDFFSAEAGQKRTKEMNENVNGLLRYLLGPTGIPERLDALSIFNPVNDMYTAGGKMKAGDYVGAATDTASALVPVGAAKLAGSGAADDIASIISDTLTGVGVKAQGAADAGRQFAGDEFGGAGPGRRGIRAYHGSPHSFDKFSMDKIGTGEGAQAYGHGLYFAENEDVAQGYRDALAHKSRGIVVDGKEKVFSTSVEKATPEEIATLWASQAIGNKQPIWTANNKARNVVMQAERGNLTAFQREAGWGDVDKMKAARDILDTWSDSKIEAMPNGSIYEVNINADPADFLDLDAPLSGQSADIQEYMRGRIDAFFPGRGPEYDPDGDILLKLASPQSGIDDGWMQEGLSVPEWATDRMKRQGIPGIKYKDAGSRGAADGTSNYVVFDENLISIVKKYGIAAAAAILGVSEMDIQAALPGGKPDGT